MVIDTSAIMAILSDEPERSEFNRKIEADPTRLMSSGTLLETAIVIESRRGVEGARVLDLFLHKAEVEVVPTTLEQVTLARRAFRQFGKGNHPAGLNFGDCFAYALTKASGEPLLCKSADFAKTDLPLC